VCVERSLCVEPVNGFSHGGQFQLDHAVTSCDDGGACPPVATCQTDHRCMPRAATLAKGLPFTSIAIGGVVVGVALFVLLLLLLILGIILWKRKNRRPR